jgi:tetratricopeptide (TPR) repeat protein
LASQYTAGGKLDKAIELLGENLDLSELYPDRNGNFTEVEIFNNHRIAFGYLLEMQNDIDAQKHLNFLEYLFPKAINESNLQVRLNLFRMKKGREEMDYQQTVKVIPQPVVSTKKTPDFENLEMKILYRQGACIKRDILHHIMELPRESVIKDLEKILIDSIARFDYLKENPDIEAPDAPIHALCLLSALKAEEALDTLFLILRQDEEYYDFWFGVMLTEDFWRYIYMMGQNRLDRLKDFVLEPNRYTYVRTAVAAAVMHVAFHQPERKEEVMKWFEDVLKYMLGHRNDANIFENHVYTSWFEDLLVVAERNHLPTVLRLFDQNLFVSEERFSLHEIKKEIARHPPGHIIRNIFASIDQYYDEWLRWSKKEDASSDDKPDSYISNELAKSFVAASKVGRNDPCPCGSGKKYKKCCGLNA